MYTGEDPRNPDTDTVRTALTDLKSNVKTYWTSHDDFVKAYTSGEVVIGNVWGSIATELKTRASTSSTSIPKKERWAGAITGASSVTLPTRISGHEMD